MRKRYLVCYDVTDARRLARTYKKMNGFGDPVQYSVFVCDLSAKERALLEAALTELLNLEEDRVLILDCGPTEGRAEDCFTLLGKPLSFPSRGPIIV
jgi:CRISPR-associated protein Cas2